MSELIAFLGMACLFLGGLLIGNLLTMSEAYNLGYATECVGQVGYYWSCFNE